MSEPSTLLTVAGLAIIVVTVGLLVWGRLSPVVAMVLVPVVGAFAVGFGPGDLQDFFSAGLDDVMSVVVMFIFAIIFFGILADAGVFDPLIRRLLLLTKGRVIAVVIGTVLIGAIAHLDGAGATTFLLTIPALLPLYVALNMSPYLLLLLLSVSASIMNMVPWGGPLGRAASATKINPVELYRPLIPLQIVGLVLLCLLAVALGVRELRRIRVQVRAGLVENVDDVDIVEVADEFTRQQEEGRRDVMRDINRGRLIYWLNVALTLAVIVVMLADVLPPELAFLIGVAIALPLNFTSAKVQMDRLRAHAPNALMMAAVIVAAAVFLGVLNKSGMLESVAKSFLAVMPDAIGPHLHLIVGAFGVPLDMLTSTDAYYFSVLPLVDSTASGFGVSSASTAHALIVGNIIGTFVSPLSPAMWLALGLAGANVGKHIRYSFLIMWGFSIVMLAAAVVMGIVTF